MTTQRIVLIGSGHLADAADRALDAGGAHVQRLHEPADAEIREALEEEVDSVVVISRSDVLSLRLALTVAHVAPGTRLLVTIFGRDVAEHLRDIVENLHVLSMADIMAPAYAGPCLNPSLLSLTRTPHGVAGIRAENGTPQLLADAWPTPGRASRIRARAGALLKPFDPSARILVGGLAGFAAVFVAEVLVTMAVGGQSLVDAFYSVAKVTVTVGPSSAAETGPDWFKVFSATAMLLTLGFAAVLTAGLVNRLLDRRLTGIFGPAAVPRREHVVVVGLGQVGLRLCELLRELRIPVVAVERDPDAPNVLRAKRQRIPVVIGTGASRGLLRRVSIQRARAVAAVTSDELENIGVAVTAHGIRDDLAITLRAGDGDATSEVRSLFTIGVVRDVYRIAGTALAAVALGYEAEEAFPYSGTLYLVNRDGQIEPFVPAE